MGIEQREQYFAARAPRFELSTAGWTDLEQRAMRGARWWSLDEVDRSAETIYPETLTETVRAILPLLPPPPPGP